MSRRPTPTALRLIQGGTARRGGVSHRPVGNKLEPRPPLAGTELPKQFAYLDRIGKAKWRELAPVLVKYQLLTVVDLELLAAFCELESVRALARRTLKRRGLTFTTGQGYVQKRPELGIYERAGDQQLKIARELGMTPTARTRIKVPSSGEGRFFDEDYF